MGLRAYRFVFSNTEIAGLSGKSTALIAAECVVFPLPLLTLAYVQSYVFETTETTARVMPMSRRQLARGTTTTTATRFPFSEGRSDPTRR